MPRALVLFDVDGTLLITGGASSRCIRRAAGRVLGERFRWGPITVGTLDPQIFLELAAGCGIDDAAGRLGPYRELYLAELDEELRRVRQEVKVMPGVREVLAALSHRDDVTIGLLTGNYRRAVELKLDAAGIEPGLFPVGAFAEDGDARHDLVPVAIRRAEQATGERLDPRRVVLVGDTPRDVACAREAGCRVLAVATGRYAVPDLAAERPDRVVANLSDPAPLYELIDEARG